MSKYRRSANGAGTIRKLSGNRRKPWQALAPAIEDKDGNFKRKSLGFFETRQEAVDALALHRLCPSATDTTLTLEALYEQWKVKGYVNLSPQSKNAYSAAWAKFSPIYKYKVTDIKTPQFQFCIDYVADSGIIGTTLNNMKILAGKLEKFAMQQDIINKNYAEFIVLPKKKKTEKPAFSDIDLWKIEQGAQNNIGVAAHILILCYTGWRIQEYCNLTVFDYDSKAHTLKGGLKTEAGKNRIVPVPDKIVPYVEQAFKDSEKLYKLSSAQFRIVFYATLDELQIKAPDGQKFTPHTTRHTYNSLLVKANVPVETRLKLMGQTDIQTNMKVYTHTDIDTLAEAVGRL